MEVVSQSQCYEQYRIGGTASIYPVVRYFIFKAPVRLPDRDLVSPKFRVQYTRSLSTVLVLVRWYLTDYLYPNLMRYPAVSVGSVPDAIMLLVSVLFWSRTCV